MDETTTRHETHEITESIPAAADEAAAAAEDVIAIPAEAVQAAAAEPSPDAATAAAERVEARLEADALTEIRSSLARLEQMHSETLSHLREATASPPAHPSSSLSNPVAAEAAELETAVQAAPELGEPVAEETRDESHRRRGLLTKRRR